MVTDGIQALGPWFDLNQERKSEFSQKNRQFIAAAAMPQASTSCIAPEWHGVALAHGGRELGVTTQTSQAETRWLIALLCLDEEVLFAMAWHTGLWQTHAVERPSLQIINRMSHYLHCLSMQPSFTQISANHHPKHWAFTDWNWNLMERYQEAWKYLIYPSNLHLFLEFIHDLIMHRAGWYDILCCHNRRDNRRLYIYIYTYLRSIAWCSFSFLFWPDKKSVFIQIRWIY